MKKKLQAKFEYVILSNRYWPEAEKVYIDYVRRKGRTVVKRDVMCGRGVRMKERECGGMVEQNGKKKRK